MLEAVGPDVIAFTRHAEDRRADRSFNRRDAERVLTNGTVAPNPEWDERFQNWKYRITGRDLDNDELSLIVAIEPSNQRITIITGL